MSDSRLIAFDDLPLQEIEKWASKIKNPNRTTILHSWKQCIELASSIENLWWPPGVGISGYFLNAAQWTQLLNNLQIPFIPFVPIPLPPREPVMPNNNPTAVQRADAIAQHKFHTQCYNIAVAGINHILKLFREAGHGMFLTPVMNATTKRFNVPPIAIKQSLLARYGLLTSKQHQEMIKTLDATKYTSGPIEGTILAINEQAEELLEEGIVIDDNKKRDILVAAVETSGQLLDGQRNYDRLPEPEKTWANAQRLFGQAYEFEQRQLSTGAAGYANQAMSHTISDSNKKNFTQRQIQRAEVARTLYARLSYPSMKDFKWIIRSNQIKDCPVTVQDIVVAEKIWGKDIATLKGKTTRCKPAPVVMDIVKVPREFMKLHKQVFLTADLFFVNVIPFFLTLSRVIYFTAVNHLADRTTDALFKASRHSRRSIFTISIEGSVSLLSMQTASSSH